MGFKLVSVGDDLGFMAIGVKETLRKIKNGKLTFHS
jgi:hypothetical protein